MDRHVASIRPSTRRRPLGDATQRANIGSTKGELKSQAEPSSSSPLTLPHNESLIPNGTLRIRDKAPSPENKRLSTVSRDSQPESKRNSAISTTSTNASGNKRKRKSLVGPWQLGTSLGQGGCATVRLVRHSITGQLGAVKIISKSTAEKVRAQSLANLIKSSEENAQLFSGDGRSIPCGIEREITIMKLLEHPNIVRLYDVWENRNQLYIIMEYVEGEELFRLIEKYHGLDEDNVVFLFRQIIAALLYCHRINIHHRDLKPENILLDRETNAIKLVDFGMAALQPAGRFLSTPCGSPHYAAPEVVQKNAYYDGAKADVWSCGVILYVMLTGATPFNYTDGQLAAMFRRIQRAEYYMPPQFSSEAKDLLRRIFVPEPKRRINMEGIWAHPLLRKYDKQWGRADLDKWIGPGPLLEDWNIKNRNEIDKEILRNLRCLWHSEKEEHLVKKLLNDEANQEKYFYNALVRHRDEHLENFPGSMTYSTSDYHHIKPPETVPNVPPLPASSSVRTKSQFSILNDEHLRSESDYFLPPPSAKSYDPYRASKNRLTPDDIGCTTVTVHRSGTRRSKGNDSRQASHAYQNSLRTVAMKKGIQKSSQPSRSDLTIRSSLAIPGKSCKRSSKSRSSLPRSSMSRSSMATSVWASSPPVISMRPSSKHKRGVSFNHVRRGSAGSAKSGIPTSIEEQFPPELQENVRLSKRLADTQQVGLSSSPAVQEQGVVRSRKERVVLDEVPIKAKRTRHQSGAFERDARKYSTELGRACEEAFFRTSVGSSSRTSASGKQNELETPPSSFSNRGSGHSAIAAKPSSGHDEEYLRNRPLPALPSETPNTFIARELAETRTRLAERYAESDGETTAKFDDVLAHLDRLLQWGGDPTSATQPTNPAGPVGKVSEPSGFLPIIREERSRGSSYGQTRDMPDRTQKDRSATDPAASTGVRQTRRPFAEQNSTIRVIEPSPPCPIPPLNIRKQSGETFKPSFVTDETYLRPQEPHEWLSRSSGPQGSPLRLQEEDEDITAIPSYEDYHKQHEIKKKSSWFKRRTAADGRDRHFEEQRASIPAPRQGEDLFAQKRNPKLGPNGAKQPFPPNASSLQPGPHLPANGQDRLPSSGSSEFPMRGRKVEATAAAISNGDSHGEGGLRKSFLRLFNKRADHTLKKPRPNTPYPQPSTMPCPGPVPAPPQIHPLRAQPRARPMSSRSSMRSSSTALSHSHTQTPSYSHQGANTTNTTASCSTPRPSRRPHAHQNLMHHHHAHAHAHSPPPPLLQPSWLVRLFHITPLRLTSLLSIPRPAARRALHRLLTSWTPFGLTVLRYDRARSRFEARVERRNTLAVKPVAFVLEAFVVLDHGLGGPGASIAGSVNGGGVSGGRGMPPYESATNAAGVGGSAVGRAGVHEVNGRAIANASARRGRTWTALRWTQVKGAASSLRRVVAEVERWAEREGWLVDDGDGEGDGHGEFNTIHTEAGLERQREREHDMAERDADDGPVGIRQWVREILG